MVFSPMPRSRSRTRAFLALVVLALALLSGAAAQGDGDQGDYYGDYGMLLKQPCKQAPALEGFLWGQGAWNCTLQYRLQRS